MDFPTSHMYMNFFWNPLPFLLLYKILFGVIQTVPRLIYEVNEETKSPTVANIRHSISTIEGGVYTFPKSISLKVNVIVQLEFKLVY